MGSSVIYHPTIICNKWRYFHPMRLKLWISTVKHLKRISLRHYGCDIRRPKWRRIRSIKRWYKTSNTFIWILLFGRHCQISWNIWVKRVSVSSKKRIGDGILLILNEIWQNYYKPNKLNVGSTPNWRPKWNTSNGSNNKYEWLPLRQALLQPLLTPPPLLHQQSYNATWVILYSKMNMTMRLLPYQPYNCRYVRITKRKKLSWQRH